MKGLEPSTFCMATATDLVSTGRPVSETSPDWSSCSLWSAASISFSRTGEGAIVDDDRPIPGRVGFPGRDRVPGMPRPDDSDHRSRNLHPRDPAQVQGLTIEGPGDLHCDAGDP